MTRTWIFAILMFFFWSQAGLAATVDFSVSEQYAVKGETVAFTFIYDPQGSTSASALLIELDYNDDYVVDYSKRIEPLDGKITQKAQITIEEAGYFEAKATFTLYDENGERINSNTLGPIQLNAANWKFTNEENLGCIESTPALAPDRTAVYFGSADHCIYAVFTEGETEGTQKWIRCVDGDVDSSPAVDSEGYVYVGSEDGNVYCLEPETGAIEWQYPAGAQNAGAFFSSPALDEEQNRVYIGSTDNCLYALNMNSGSLEWQFKTRGKIVSSPAIGFDHTIYIGSLDTFLYALNQDGSLKWRFGADSEIRGSPALDQDGTIFFGTSSFQGEFDKNNGLYAVSTTGQLKWFAEKANGFQSTPVIGDNGTVVIGSWDNKMYGIHRSGGRLTMYKTFKDDMISAAALGGKDFLFAGAKDGNFYGLSLNEGDQRSGRTEYWNYQTPSPITTSSPAIGRGYVFVGTCKNDGEAGNGAVYSFLFDNNTGGDTNIGPAEDAPWPQFRNRSCNSGMTELRQDTVAPEVAETNPAPGVRDFNTDRRSITAKFSMPMEPSSIYRPPDPDNNLEGFFGFTVEPFDAPPEDFTIDWNAEQTEFTLTLPEDESFEREKEYTATIKSIAHAEGEPDRQILYDYEWTFEHDPEESHDNSHDRFTCFISSIWESSPLVDFMADLW
ncbi:MAG: PQQ-binding-like beta-propeller repeat protein [Desulfobacteraceae bacterium]|nr:PQQ-binding-like beta-propeller repeat protein [Desulfobacteraceae bacterium]